MAGRGRGTTLPAWMTNPETADLKPAVAAPSSSASSEQFSDAVVADSLIDKSEGPPRVFTAPPTTGPQTNTTTALPAPKGPPSFAQPPQFNAPPQFAAPPQFQAQAVPLYTQQYPQQYPGYQQYPGMQPQYPHPMGMPMGLMGGYGGPRPIGGPLAAAPRPAPAPAAQLGDPTNDVASWSEHEGADKRVYWYNKVLATSTYDKPFCLKTPEERSIVPCKWKEYANAEGKKYYSDGKESLWVVPDEYRVWKQQTDAVEEKKKQALLVAAQPLPLPFTAPVAVAAVPAVATSSSSNRRKHEEEERKRREEEELAKIPAIVYASHEEAVEAFKAMMTEKRVSATMKMKEVVDLCTSDPRYVALKTGGERKQALAEYQTRTLKLEKELQKNKARKSRDSFLLMLAENTEIDARTRWRDAVIILQDDVRYKHVEDPRDREDLFSDFVSELEKKEKEDRVKQRETALNLLEALFISLHEKNILSRKSSWTEDRDVVLKNVKGSEFKALEDMEIKRSFQDFIGKLDTIYREAEKQRKDALQKKVDVAALAFKELLEKLSFEGHLTATGRWKDWSVKVEIKDSTAYRDLEDVVGGGIKDGVASSSSVGIAGTARDVFEQVLVVVRENYRADKRLVREVLEDLKFELKVDSLMTDYKYEVYMAAGMKGLAEREKMKTGDNAAITEMENSLAEDGEEVEDIIITSKRVYLKQLKSMLVNRPTALEFVYEDLFEEVKVAYEEEARRQRKREERYIELLEEYFYRSDHVGVPWEDAKRALDRHSAYDALTKTERKKIYSLYMEELARKMEKFEVKNKRDTKDKEESRERDKDRGRDSKGDDIDKRREGDLKRERDSDRDKKDSKDKKDKKESKPSKDKDGDRHDRGSRGSDRGDNNGHLYEDKKIDIENSENQGVISEDSISNSKGVAEEGEEGEEQEISNGTASKEVVKEEEVETSKIDTTSRDRSERTQDTSKRDRSDSNSSSDRNTSRKKERDELFDSNATESGSRKREREEVIEKSEPLLKKVTVMEEGEEEDEEKEAVSSVITHVINGDVAVVEVVGEKVVVDKSPVIVDGSNIQSEEIVDVDDVVVKAEAEAAALGGIEMSVDEVKEEVEEEVKEVEEEEVEAEEIAAEGSMEVEEGAAEEEEVQRDKKGNIIKSSAQKLQDKEDAKEKAKDKAREKKEEKAKKDEIKKEEKAKKDELKKEEKEKEVDKKVVAKGGKKGVKK